MKIESEIITGQGRIKLENGAVINRYTHILPGAEIGADVMIGEFCYIGAIAKIGDRSRIQNHVNIYDGVEIGKDVFVGPKVCFTNHHNPRERFNKHKRFVPDFTIVGNNATICANVTIIAPCVIGSDSLIGAGSVVVRNIKKGEKVNWLVK